MLGGNPSTICPDGSSRGLDVFGDPNETTHGSMTVPTLLAMLAEDAAMTNSRPGSWEGSSMQQVLDSHGYQ